MCCGLEKNGMVGTWHRHGMASVNQTRPHCVNQTGKTNSKPLAARHARGTAWARHAMCESAFRGSSTGYGFTERTTSPYQERSISVKRMFDFISSFRLVDRNDKGRPELSDRRKCFPSSVHSFLTLSHIQAENWTLRNKELYRQRLYS